MTTARDPLEDVLDFPLLAAIWGRRSRRFGRGMTLPTGPLAFTSAHEPAPLSPEETDLLLAAGTGVTGWSFGVPFGPDRPHEHASFTQRFTGRAAPTAAGFGTPVLFFTDDDGTYLTDTRDTSPETGEAREEREPGEERDTGEGSAAAARRMMAICRQQTTRLSDRRLDLPAAPPHMLPPNTWMANAPGSTLFVPAGDASEQTLGLLAMALAAGTYVVDDVHGGPAGDLAPFVRSGLLDEQRPAPLSMLQQIAYETNLSELDFIAHNIVLAMQAMGLGGLYLAGLNRLSVLGAFATPGVQGQGVDGLGFTFVRDDAQPLPNPVGLDGHYEALCPPYVADMREAVERFVARKFGPGGAYDPATPGPWRDPASVKRQVSPYSDEFVSCLATVAQHIYDTRGRFPGSPSTIVVSGFVQAVHLDTDYYDTHYASGAYLRTHAEHWQRWHAQEPGWAS